MWCLCLLSSFFFVLWSWGMLLGPCCSFHFVRGANNQYSCCFSQPASSCNFYQPLKVTRFCGLLACCSWCLFLPFWYRSSCDIGFLLAACLLILLIFCPCWFSFPSLRALFRWFSAVFVVPDASHFLESFDQLLSFLYRCLNYRLFCFWSSHCFVATLSLLSPSLLQFFPSFEMQ